MKKINAKFSFRPFLYVILFTSLAACKKKQIDAPASTDPLATSGMTKTLALKALADVNTNADAAFNAFNASFLMTSGNTQYYKEALNVATKDYFWRQALDIQMAEDVYLRTKSAAHKTLITNLLNTFLQQNQGTGGLTDWNWNHFNDDLQWAGLAFIRGYQITGNTAYLDQAKYTFNRTYDRGWTADLGGGLWWDDVRSEKSGLSNNPEVMLGCYIYEATKEVAYLNKAIAIYAWVKSTLYNGSTGAVSEKITANGVLFNDANVYNVGAFVGAANHLHRLTGNSMYYDDAIRSIEYVKNNKTTNGIITVAKRDGTWQSEFSRGLGEFVRDNNLWSTYYTWMKQNADAAWNSRRTDRNLTWNTWASTMPSDNIANALECLGGVVMQQVTPVTQPAGLTSNLVYRLTPKVNEGSAIDINGAASGSLAQIYGWNNGGNQKFRITSLGYGYYRLVPQHNTATSVDVTGGSSANNTPIEIYTTQANNGAQMFKMIYDYDGYYKLKPKCAPFSCVNVTAGNPANLTKLVLWPESFGDNERYSMTVQ
ncbi:Ricin-type beta-trefoil lectin domain-like [Pedobacter westerhofensis]|uniref:Ricin-type beta-trefoil lectin domain-like n=1 Tax=Pedobacter westerhofensis TaxID=425512 RepID=A0A521FKX3_9SPHI|nr:glycoside hydrolase family 76 protein [Pedobacter westerhofensis]SMO96786.1 Ricin-type beta-trefoil lectin domain-like [Pedobacter westerhofensis]